MGDQEWYVRYQKDVKAFAAIGEQVVVDLDVGSAGVARRASQEP